MKYPNVLLLTIDTLRADWLGCYGHPKAISPHMDAFAEKSMRFTQAVTGGSWTQAAFPVMMTSTYASMYGGCLGPLSEERPSPISTLTIQGYKTAGFSTSPLLSKTFAYDQGFEQFIDLVPNEKDNFVRKMKGGQSLLRNPLFHQLALTFGQNMRPAKVYEPAEVLVDSVIDWLSLTNGPFFAWAHFMDVHWPYHLEDQLTKPMDIAQAWEDLVHLHEVNWKGASISDDQKAHYIGLYEKAIRYTDAEIGRLLNWLEQSPLADDTIIIIVSDHGEEFMERGYWGHVEINLYDEILKVPMLMRLPGQQEGQVIEQQVRTLDIMPTVLELCNCEIPERTEGSSFAPLWNGNPAAYDQPVSISERWREENHVVAVRTEAFKYIWDSETPEQPKLYDLLADPKELTNVVANFPTEAEYFQTHVDAHLAKVEASKPDEKVEEPQLDKNVVNRLRDLGYVE
ncbi:MAG: sulfatase [Chloroflexota bacterium]